MEAFLEAGRDQLALWLPVALGAGIAAWFLLPDATTWVAWLLGMGALACFSWLVAGGEPHAARAARCRACFGGRLWRDLGARHQRRGSGPDAPGRDEFHGNSRADRSADCEDRVRLTLAPVDVPTLPPRVRVSVDHVMTSSNLVRGDRITLRARLVGPPSASVPGGFDFSRVAWFQGLGATGKAIGPVTRIGPAIGERTLDS